MPFGATGHQTALASRSRAFSLLELLVVIAISAIVIGIALPSLSSARESAHIAICLGNMRELGQASGSYIQDTGFPTQPWHLGFNHPGGDIQKGRRNGRPRGCPRRARP